MNTETATTNYTVEEKLYLISVLKSALQALLVQYNLQGNQELAFSASRDLCAVLAAEFRLNPKSRRAR